ncbi:class II aldolase/adducin family protein [Aeromicrobium sp. CTD01-1L150]|uniref:class II aldolase/adducin family protein n=1 Tax=Aeromicrobium sp. CTD01-1L150 TaxID=3341830 RepID=UPI0035BF1B89
MSSDGLDDIREEIADACRVMAMRRLAPGILGHISVRIDQDRLAIRCRHPDDRGLAFTRPDDVRVVRFDSSAGGPGELDGGHTPPFELPLHAAVLRRRPDVTCVVHAHPADVVAADLAGLRIRPIVGAFDIPGSALARAGVPIYPRSVLVRDDRLGDEMVDHLGESAALVLRGHGITSTGASVPEAVLRAISLNGLAALSLSIVQAGGQLQDISADDVAELPDLGSSLNHQTAWQHELACLDLWSGMPSV